MFTIYVDVEFTARKRLTHIMNGSDEVVWSGPNFGAALQFLKDHGERSCEIYTQYDDCRASIMIEWM